MGSEARDMKKIRTVAAAKAVDPHEGGAQASGLYDEPTAAQVERLIAAAAGEEYRPVASLYQKPTYAQFERLIAVVGSRRSRRYLRPLEAP